MIYRGTLKQGVVVLDEPPPLRDGTRVKVQLVEDTSTPTDQRFHPVGAWDGPPGELDHLLHEVQELRDADLNIENRDEDASLSP